MKQKLHHTILLFLLGLAGQSAAGQCAGGLECQTVSRHDRETEPVCVEEVRNAEPDCVSIRSAARRGSLRITESMCVDVRTANPLNEDIRTILPVREGMSADTLSADTLCGEESVSRTLPLRRKNFFTRRSKGRYSRGVTNYLFVPKGQWMGGLSASYANFDSKDSRMLLSLIDDFDFYGYTVKVNPYAGYFFKDNQCVGLKFGYTRTIGRLGNLGLVVEDMDLSLKDMYLSEDLLSGTLFHRSYVGLDSRMRFAVFNETALSVGRGSTRFTRGKEGEPGRQDTRTAITEVQLGFNPGLSVFIMNNVSTEVSFGILGLKYRNERQTDGRGETGSYNSSGANFKINLFNINIGITIHI